MALEKIKRLVEKDRCKGRKVLAEVADSVPLEVICKRGLLYSLGSSGKY